MGTKNWGKEGGSGIGIKNNMTNIFFMYMKIYMDSFQM